MKRPVLKWFALAAVSMLLTGCYTGKIRRIVDYGSDHYMTVGDVLYRPKNLQYLPHIEQRHLEWIDSPPPIGIDPTTVARLAMLRHEQVHAVQQKGIVKGIIFQVSYLLSKKKRWQAEAEAYAAEIRTYIEYQCWKPWMRSQFVQYMMGEHYGNMTDKETAQLFVDTTVSEAQNASR